ncbi:MAG: c-type cytochrome [Gemmatimonadales bacterium]|jgi:mono/diheme cytochrome c family protein
MLATNLKIVVVVILTLTAYTLVANVIPQIESEVPEELDLSGEVTTDQLIAAGERIYNGAGGCVACHGLGTRAPNLLTPEGEAGPIGSRCGNRQPGVTCRDYLYTSLTNPGDYVVEGYDPIMPDIARILSQDQIWALIAFLQSHGGEVTVTAADLTGSAGAEQGSPGAAQALSVPAGLDPRALMNELGCLTCHKLGEEGTAIGPALTDVGARRDAAYIRESILDPAAQAAEGYENFAGVMPTNFGDRITASQLEALVAFLAEQRGGG